MARQFDSILTVMRGVSRGRAGAIALMLAAACGIGIAMAQPAPKQESAQESAEEVVRAFAKVLFDQAQFREAFMRYVAPDLIQHDFLMPDGRDATIALLEKRQAQNFRSSNRVIVAQGDLAVVFHRVEVHGKSLCEMDMYRVKNGLITEHWQVKQEIPEVRANKNEMC